MKLLIVGVGGPSSSGKTTICHSLLSIFPHCTLIHLDDFYFADSKIPIDPKYEIENWDCAEAINWTEFRDYINEIRKTSGDVLPVESKEFDSSLLLSEEELKEVKQSLNFQFSAFSKTHVVLIDGFMLYHDSSIYDHFDVKLYFRAPYQTLKARREARAGYVTEEGFWVDPPGYFDKIVWPQYVLTHGYLFEQNNVDGKMKDSTVAKGIIDINNDGKKSLKDILLITLQDINDSR